MAIKISCPNCDRSYNLADSMAGRLIRCKDCEETFRVDQPDADDGAIVAEELRSTRKSAITSRRSRETAAEDDDRPRTKKKSNKSGGLPVGLLVGGGVGLLLVVGVIVLLVVLLGGGNGKLTAENVAKVKMGMSEREVIALVGQPTETIDPRIEAGKLGLPAGDVGNALLAKIPKAMKWSKNDINLVVAFVDGKATTIIGGSSGDAAKTAVAPPTGGITFHASEPPAQPPSQPPVAQPQPPVTQPQPAPPPDESKLTKENFAKLKVGMSEQEITALIGNPALSRPAQPSGKVLIWGTGLNIVQVQIVSEKATSITGLGIFQSNPTPMPVTGLPGPAPGPATGPAPNPGSKLTAENLAKVQLGMSEKQLTDLLGPANQTANRTIRQGTVTTTIRTLGYVSPMGRVTFLFRNNQLVGRQ